MLVYLVFLSVFFAVPVAVLLLAVGKDLRRIPRTVLWSLAFVATLGLAWDWLSIRTGLWRYDTAPTIGIWLGGLPVEEFGGFYLLGTLLIVGTAVLFLGRTRHV